MPIIEKHAFAESLVSSNGVDAHFNDGVQMNHYGDWVKLKGRPEVGSTFSVQYNYEGGEIDKLPEDFQFTLLPGMTETIYNRRNHGEFEGVKFIVDIRYIGQAPADELFPPEPEDVSEGRGTAEAFPNLIFPRLRAIVDRIRGGR